MISDDPFLLSASRQLTIPDDLGTISDVRLHSSASSHEDPFRTSSSQPRIHDTALSSSNSSNSNDGDGGKRKHKAVERLLDDRTCSTSSDDPLVRKTYHKNQHQLSESDDRFPSTSSADDGKVRRSGRLDDKIKYKNAALPIKFSCKNVILLFFSASGRSKRSTAAGTVGSSTYDSWSKTEISFAS